MKKFDALRGRYDHVFMQSGRLYEPQCRLVEDSLASSFNAYFVLIGRAGLDEKNQHLAAFFYRNCVYLSAAYQMIRMGMLDPAGNNLRTVFETIIWQYAYLTDDEIYGNFRGLIAIDSEKLRLIKERKWSNTRERELENLRRKYSFQKMMKKLYSKEAYERFFFNQYWMLCQKSHSSIFGVNSNTPNMEGTTTLEKRPQEILNNLSALLYLLAENLICYLNCFYRSLAQADIDSVLKAANGINRMIPPAAGLSPDTKRMEFTLTFKEV